MGVLLRFKYSRKKKRDFHKKNKRHNSISQLKRNRRERERENVFPHGSWAGDSCDGPMLPRSKYKNPMPFFLSNFNYLIYVLILHIILFSVGESVKWCFWFLLCFCWMVILILHILVIISSKRHDVRGGLCAKIWYSMFKKLTWRWFIWKRHNSLSLKEIIIVESNHPSSIYYPRITFLYVRG